VKNHKLLKFSNEKTVVQEQFITIAPGTPICIVKASTELTDQPGGCMMETMKTLRFKEQECFLIPREQLNRIMDGVNFTLEDMDDRSKT